MNTSQNLNLKNLIKDYKYESTTEKIRNLKHSKKYAQMLHKFYI